MTRQDPLPDPLDRAPLFDPRQGHGKSIEHELAKMPYLTITFDAVFVAGHQVLYRGDCPSCATQLEGASVESVVERTAAHCRQHHPDARPAVAFTPQALASG